MFKVEDVRCSLVGIGKGEEFIGLFCGDGFCVKGSVVLKLWEGDIWCLNG